MADPSSLAKIASHLAEISALLAKSPSLFAKSLPLLVAGAIGFASAVLAEPVRRRLFSPKFKVEFIEGEIGFITDTRAGRHDAHYVRARIMIEGFGIAKQCLAYLVNVEKWDESTGEFEPTIYCDSLQLAWSAKVGSVEPYRALDIPKGVPQFIDIVRTLSNRTNYEVMTKFRLNRYIALFEEHGKFRYTVLVSGDNVKPKLTKVVFVWSGDWDNFTATAGE